MGDLDSANLVFSTRITKTAVQEDKKSEDAVVETTFEGEIGPGAFKEYSKDLEYLVFQNRAWESVKCGYQRGQWVMTITDPNEGVEIVRMKECGIKNIAVKIGKEDVKVATLTIAHKFTKQQKALECAVSTVVDLSLDRDIELLPGVDDGEPEPAPKKKAAKKKGAKKTAAPPESGPFEIEPTEDLLTGDDADGTNPEPTVTEMVDDDSNGGQTAIGEEKTL